MSVPVYILIRTSGRPAFFKACMDSVCSQTYKNIITLVHTDDPRDTYVTGDIIVKGVALPKQYGSGTYNLYNNTLLKNIPDQPGWIYFLDDDDVLYEPDSIEKLVSQCKKTHVNVCRVVRWNGTVHPAGWKKQKTFQTECFMIHTDHKNVGRWWSELGGDHNYTEQLTDKLPINWIENLIVCKAQEGKGHGKRLDKNGKQKKTDITGRVSVFGIRANRTGARFERIRQGEFKLMPIDAAEALEARGIVKITYPDIKPKIPVNHIYKY